jgi:hypothetical protein
MPFASTLTVSANVGNSVKRTSGERRYRSRNDVGRGPEPRGSACDLTNNSPATVGLTLVQHRVVKVVLGDHLKKH